MSAVRALAALVLALSVTLACEAQQEPAIAGIWLPDASRSQRFPAQPPYTDEGRRVVTEWRASHDPIEDDPGKFCQAPGMPSLALGGADYPLEIVVTEQQITILMELHQQIRRVFMNQEHPARPFPQRNGHSVGRWEGDTLVVDTVGIKAITFGSVPHSNRVHVVERIRAIDGGKALLNEVTITDPVMYTGAVTVQQFYRAAPNDTRMLEYECTEGMWEDHEAARTARQTGAQKR
ncbi:MAG TPA: hypothetical protein VNP02_05605 [Gammaproteobacteria bacterium]|jgi:hypothetical protein|nr:hypothetical protein [Gammaproteobacteria bacterium]